MFCCFATLVQNRCYRVSDEVGLASISPNFCYKVSDDSPVKYGAPASLFFFGQTVFSSMKQNQAFFATTKKSLDFGGESERVSHMQARG
jgi:hypothetical protein